jgi:tRNA-dihydrouridine synthase B
MKASSSNNLMNGDLTPSLKPLRIGGLEVGFPVTLGALAGYSDLPYRLLCRSLGAPYCVTEAMLDRQVLAQGRLRKRLVATDPADHPVAGQIMGREPEVMAEAAAALDAMGFDAVDLNFACPVRKVVSRGRGGALMKEPETALAIVRAVVKAVPHRPVTLKLRRAFHEDGRTAGDFWRIARGAIEAGASALSVHARSVERKYTGRADWGFLAALKREFPDRTILGSGDVMKAADALRMLDETGVDGVLAARGAIGNPWFFRQARDLAAGREPYRPPLDEQKEMILKHYGLLCEFFGPGRGFKKIVHYGLQYAKLHPRRTDLRNALVAAKTEERWRAVLDAFYAPCPGIRG